MACDGVPSNANEVLPCEVPIFPAPGGIIYSGTGLSGAGFPYEWSAWGCEPGEFGPVITSYAWALWSPPVPGTYDRVSFTVTNTSGVPMTLIAVSFINPGCPVPPPPLTFLRGGVWSQNPVCPGFPLYGETEFPGSFDAVAYTGDVPPFCSAPTLTLTLDLATPIGPSDDYYCALIALPATASESEGADCGTGILSLDCVEFGGGPSRAITIPTCDTSQLGTGNDLKVLLTTRGGTNVLAELNPTSGSFTRDLDATSNLEMTGVTTGMMGDSCCDGWDLVYPWNTEIMVYRDGRDAWAGPVTGVEFGYGTVKVTASDLTAWWDRRVLTTSLTFTNVDLAAILQSLHEEAMDQDPVDNFFVSTTASGVIGTRSYNLSDYKYVSDLIDELSKTGVDWTAYGRTLLIGGEEVPASPYVSLTDEFWSQPPTVNARGNEQATRVIVKGKGVTGVAVASPEYVNYYGLLTRVFDESTIEDQGSATAAANSRLALLKDQLYIDTPQGATLKPTAPITVPELIPGIRVRVESSSTCRQIVQDFRLKSVKVQFNGQVSIDLQPIGTLGLL